MRVGLEPLNGRLWALFDAPYLSQGQEEALVTTQAIPFGSRLAVE